MKNTKDDQCHHKYQDRALANDIWMGSLHSLSVDHMEVPHQTTITERSGKETDNIVARVQNLLLSTTNL